MKRLTFICFAIVLVMAANAQQVESYPDSQRYLFNQYNPLDSLLDSVRDSPGDGTGSADMDAYLAQKYAPSHLQQNNVVYGVSCRQPHKRHLYRDNPDIRSQNCQKTDTEIKKEVSCFMIQVSRLMISGFQTLPPLR